MRGPEPEPTLGGEVRERALALERLPGWTFRSRPAPPEV